MFHFVFILEAHVSFSCVFGGVCLSFVYFLEMCIFKSLKTRNDQKHGSISDQFQKHGTIPGRFLLLCFWWDGVQLLRCFFIHMFFNPPSLDLDDPYHMFSYLTANLAQIYF